MATVDQTVRARSEAAPVEVSRPFLERPLGIWTVRIITFVVIMSAWEIYGQGVSRALFAPISEIAQSLWELTFESDAIVEALGQTLFALSFGYVIASVVGVGVGLIMGTSRRWEYILDPYVSFLYGIPRVALIPLLVIWFGIGPALRISIVFLSCVFPIIINTKEGVKEVDPELIDVGIVSCANRRQLLRTVVIPASLPYIFAGLQLGLGLSLIGVIVAEMTAIITGLGGLVIEYANFFRTADMFVPIIYIAAFAVLSSMFMRWLRRRLMPWQEGLSE